MKEEDETIEDLPDGELDDLFDADVKEEYLNYAGKKFLVKYKWYDSKAYEKIIEDVSRKSDSTNRSDLAHTFALTDRMLKEIIVSINGEDITDRWDEIPMPVKKELKLFFLPEEAVLQMQQTHRLDPSSLTK